MKAFLEQFRAYVLGILIGFDRLRFRGDNQRLLNTGGIASHLIHQGVLLRDFKAHAYAITQALYAAVETPAKERGLFRYLTSSSVCMEEEALRLAAEHQRTEGLIAVLARVEPCQVVQVRANRDTKKLEPRAEPSKCLHYYHYFLDPQFGLRYTRLQTWYPYTVHVGFNARDWLGQQLVQAGIRHTKNDNCFTWIEDLPAAQAKFDELLTFHWTELLEGWLTQSLPDYAKVLRSVLPYYWIAQQAEYATDVLFRSPQDLAKVYPTFVHHAYTTLQSGHLLRFMNYRLYQNHQPHAKVHGEVQTSLREWEEGTSVRHFILGNLLKMYDKKGSVLRIESLLHDLHHFWVFRPDQGRMLRMRKGVADLHARAQVSQRINDRYLASLATVQQKRTLAEVTADLTRRTTWKGRSVRALNPLAEADAKLLAAVGRGAFLIHGFRNRDMRAILYGVTDDDAVRKKQASAVTRLLALLRGHGLITKVPKTHRYQLTEKGRSTVTLLQAARTADTQKLLQAA
jgi:hypothetical protein